MAANNNKMVIDTYQERYKRKPKITIYAPGRINLIGEHTDYSDGYVLPAAINLGISIALSPRDGETLQLYSIDFEQNIMIDLNDMQKEGSGWQEYIKGVAWVLKEEGYPVSGWQGVLSGNIPIGAGLSSSAALEIATLEAFSRIGDFSLSPETMAKLGRKAETGWVGVNVGIMDQLISAAGRANHAVLLDCRTLDFEYVPVPEEISIVVLDTKTRRELSNSAYNTRHKEVRQAARALGVEVLRDASLQELNYNKENLPENVYKRARHVISENERVHEFSKAMRIGKIEEMGRLINLSHQSLRDDFEVSSDELNMIVTIAQEQSECLGARMAGAGFGGCALALIKQSSDQNFTSKVHDRYLAETNIKPHIFKVEISEGVSSEILK